MNRISDKVQEDREFFDRLGNAYPAEESVAIKSKRIEGVACYWFTPEDYKKNNIIIYLHGGSYVLGSIQSHKAMVSHFASKLSARILFIEYALAPEEPFPNGVQDVLNVYQHIFDSHSHTKISIIGDSAGGGIAVSFIKMAQKESLPMPESVVLISPWLNLKCDTESHKNRKKTGSDTDHGYVTGVCELLCRR